MIDHSHSPIPKPTPKTKKHKGLNYKRTRKHTGVDMSMLPLGKTNRYQREDVEVRKKANRVICEIPNCRKKAQTLGPHHAIKRSQILIDHKLNLINLCDEHHEAADKYEISQVDIYEIIAEREHTTVEQLLKDLGDFAGVVLYIEGDRVKVKRG